MESGLNNTIEVMLIDDTSIISRSISSVLNDVLVCCEISVFQYMVVAIGVKLGIAND